MRLARFIQQNVPRFNIAMENAMLVGVMNRARDFRDQFYRAPNRHLLVPNDFVELSAFDEFHAEIAGAITLADFVNRNDARMV